VRTARDPVVAHCRAHGYQLHLTQQVDVVTIRRSREARRGRPGYGQQGHRSREAAGRGQEAVARRTPGPLANQRRAARPTGVFRG